jgi:hypothetical protein
MRRTSNILIAAATCALALGAIGVPAAAAGAVAPSLDPDPAIRVVNGLPGTRLDVCVNGNEIKSRLRYGRSIPVPTSGLGKYKIVFKQPRAGKCKGATVAKQKIEFLGFGDVSVVAAAARGGPIVRVFENNQSPASVDPAPYSGSVIYHHAAKSASVDIFRGIQITPVAGPLPVANLKRGKTWANFVLGNVAWHTWVAKAGTTKALAGPVIRQLENGHNVFVFVGNNKRNYRLVTFVTSLIVG